MRRQTIQLSTRRNTFLSLHRAFLTDVMDVAWADLMLYEGKKWFAAKCRKSTWDQSKVRFWCVNLSAVCDSTPECCFSTNPSAVNVGEHHLFIQSFTVGS